MRDAIQLGNPINKLPFDSTFLLAVGILLAISFSSGSAYAHAPGENYVWVNIEDNHISGRFEIHIDDLKKKLDIDWEKHGETRVAGVEASKEIVYEYLKQHFQIVIDGKPIELQFGKTSVFKENGRYAQYFYTTSISNVPDKFTIKNDIFITPDDPLHRSLIVLEYNKKIDAEYGGENAIMAFGPYKPEQELDLNNLPALLNPGDFIWQGILHIWIGLDHILFLLALLLMAVMIIRPIAANESVGESATTEHLEVSGTKIEPVATFGKAFWNVFKIVTIFTVAHSITLSLAALKLIDVNSQFVESLIALSIVFVALNNIFPKFDDKKWLIIFFFGLFHGMGFASVMGVLPFRTVSLVKVLLSFNVGVELGQLAIVAIAFPVIFMLRKTPIYRPVVLIGGSLLIGGIATYWFIERSFGI